MKHVYQWVFVGLLILLVLGGWVTVSHPALAAPDAPSGESTLGDFVWHDLNLNGLWDVNEPGINGVLIEAYLDDGDNVFEPGGDDVLVGSMFTGDNPSTPDVESGWYDFDVDFGPTRNHWVVIPASNFAPGGPLAGYLLTSANTIYPNPAYIIEPQLINDRNDADFGFARVGITLAKTVYLGHNSGNSCATAGELATGLNGAAVTYCFTVTNTGVDAYLGQLTISDPNLGISVANMTLKSGTLPLAPGASALYYYQTTITQDLVNTASASGTPVNSNNVPYPEGPKPNDGDTAQVDRVAPAVELQKTVYLGHNSGASCPGGELIYGLSNAAVTYCFVVVNSGDTHLSNLTLTDNALNITLANLTLRSGTLPLAPGQSLVYYYQTTITGDLLNSATVSGNPVDSNGNDLPGLIDPSKTDTATVEQVAPALDLQKSVYLGHNSGSSCASAVESVVGVSGTSVTYCFQVTNTGDTHLGSLTLTDSTLGISLSSMTLKSGTFPLAPGASALYYYQTTLTQDLVNTATASATPVTAGNVPLPGVSNPSDTDTAAVDHVTPGMDLQKTVYLGHNSGASCPGVERVAGVISSTITYCFSVTNTGDTHLTNITLSDLPLGITQANMTLASGSTPLAPGGKLVYYYQTTITRDLLPNTANSSGTPSNSTGTTYPGVPTQSDLDTAHVDLVTPALAVEKTVYLGQDSGAACPGLETVIGVNATAITFCFKVTNTGDTHLGDVTLIDASLGINQSHMTLKSGTLPLAPNASLVYYYHSTITQDLTNLVNASGNPVDAGGADLPGVPNPTDSDTANVDQVFARVELAKSIYLGHDNGASCPGLTTLSANNGAAITYCFRVTNTGETYLNAITIDDPLLNTGTPTITLRSGLLPLAPNQTLYYYYQTTAAGDLNNTATVTGNPVDPNGMDLPGVPEPEDAGSALLDAQGPGLDLQKSVYLGHDNGASCVGVEQVEGARDAAITYCFQVRNLGDSYLGDIAINDPSLGITINQMQLLTGTVPLAPRASLLYYYQTQLTGTLRNTANANGNPVDANGNDIPGLAKPADEDSATVRVRGGSISGTVWMDKNGNGQIDPDEPGIPGVTVTLNNGTTRVTDQNGDYRFDNLPDGTYSVTETDLPGYTSTGDKDGGNPNLISNLTILNGNDIVDQDFLDAPQFGKIVGVVFNDTNGSLLQDSNEPGLPGVLVTLSNGQTTFTDPTGHYTFTNLLPGPYTVVESDPTGFASTTNNTVPVVVPSGGTAVANFGDKQIGSITGVVFNDVNGDGIKQPTENGLGSVTVQLLDSQNNVIRTTTTAPDGSYSFPDVPPGAYTVREVDPTNFTSTTNNSVPVSVSPAGTATANFGDQQIGVISGMVFNDKNGNGQKTPDEEGLPNVIIQLLDSSGQVIRTTTTGPDGSYEFTNVPPGSYTVREVDPTGYTSTTGNTLPVSVLPGGGAVANFGDQQVGTISGVVFNDVNGNGAKESTESPLGGVIVQLYDPKNNLLGTTLTDVNGNYTFPNVPPGAYIVREIDPPGYASTTNNLVPVSVPPGGAATANFGDQQIGVISGVVFNDTNGDGIQNPGESGLSGVKVDLLDVNGNVITKTVTGGDGSYQFTALRPTAYIVREHDPQGYTSTTNNDVPVVVPPGGIGVANFGDQQRSTISGVVFNDTNGDGQRDPSENGIGGVKVELVDSTGQVITSTLTAGDGTYHFPNVPPGDYIVRESDPQGFTSTTPNTVAVTVTPGGSATANFGDRQVGTISGVVFNDSNGDGVQGPNEPGIGGVTIQLLDITDQVITTTTTAGNGSYTFVNVPPGSYTVREVDPPNYASTTNNDVPVTVPNGGSATANFGDRQVGTISGIVYEDTNENRVQDPNEPGMGGVTVQLIDSEGRVVQTTTTAGDGSYVFTNVPPGQYTIVQTDFKGSDSTTPNTVSVTVTPEQPTVSVNFGDVVVFPKAITLERLYAVEVEGALQIHWQTGVEIDTFGYHIVRSESEDRDQATRMTPRLLPSLGMQGGVYSFTDTKVAKGKMYTYWLVEVTLTGETNDYGPIYGGLDQKRLYLPVVER
jgi:uncharacterized repeat protein (TIGR01451 family)